MNEKIKDYIGLAAIFALALFALSAVSYVKTYSKSIEPSAYRSFSVSGEGKVVAIPDVAQFSFTVITEGGTDLAAMQAMNTSKINEAIKFLKDEGVQNADIKTQNYSVSPRYQYFNCSPRVLADDFPSKAGVKPCPPPEIAGYTINQTVSVKARNFGKIGSFLSGVVQNGANSVSGPDFTIDRPTEIENQARGEAIKNAKEKAEQVAEVGGFKLGRILAITEGGRYYPMRKFAEVGADYGMGGDGAAAPTIEPGSQDVIINVSITYEIK